jgi:hypothetical protein
LGSTRSADQGGWDLIGCPGPFIENVFLQFQTVKTSLLKQRLPAFFTNASGMQKTFKDSHIGKNSDHLMQPYYKRLLFNGLKNTSF